MKKKLIASILLISVAFFSNAQKLDVFTTTLELNASGKSAYVSIPLKKTVDGQDAVTIKTALDIVLIRTIDDKKKKLEWYTMNSKDSRIPNELSGNNTIINAISFDREQFDKCITNQDLNRMTGYLTKNSFSFFASITDNLEKGIIYPCFIIQFESGKRALLWIEKTDDTHFNITVKTQV